MQRWNEASDNSPRGAGHRTRDPRGGDPLDRWVERTRDYLRSRTLDHWLMFVGGLLLGALLT